MKYYFLEAVHNYSKEKQKDYYMVYVLCEGSGHKYIPKNVFVNEETYNYFTSNNEKFDDISQLVHVSLKDDFGYSLFISI